MQKDPERLRRYLNALIDERKKRPFTPEEAAAASECAFRIAVHLSTEATEAFTLLQLAIRWDKANPTQDNAEPVRSDNGQGPTASEEPPSIRILDSGRCRWTGVHDLMAEKLLEAESSEYSRDKLREPLEAAAKHNRKKTGGHAA